MEDSYTSQIILGLLVTFIAGAIGYLSKRLRLYVYGWWQGFRGDFPNVKGSWRTTYFDLDDQGNRHQEEEIVELKQRGAYVNGDITPTSRPEAKFSFQGSIRRNLLVGMYERSNSLRTTGTGSFALKIKGSEDSMEGRCIWHDYDSDNVEESIYIWTRSPDA